MQGLQATLLDNWGRFSGGTNVFLIEDLMLLCILEEDASYRPSVKTVRPGQDQRLSICKKSRVATAAFRWFCGIGQQGHLGAARSGHALTLAYIWCAKTGSLISHLGIRIHNVPSARRNGTPKRICFSKTRKGALDFQLRDFMLCSYSMEAERKRYGFWVQSEGKATISLTNSLCHLPLPDFAFSLLLY